MKSILIWSLIGYSSICYSEASRLKDISTIKGNRDNSLMGLGLIVGLPGTGDSPASLATNRALANLFERLGMGKDFQGNVTQSMAIVMVNGQLPAFAKNGMKLDVKVSTLGDATSLSGGTLLPAQLKAGDGRVYVVAEGSLVTAGANGAGAQTLTSFPIPGGGVVEREFTPDIVDGQSISLMLNESDFTTSSRVADRINSHFKGFYAKAMDPVTVKVDIPPLFVGKALDFISEVEGLRVNKDQTAIVVLNERTGTVIIGSDVTIQPVVISHGDLTVRVGDQQEGENNSLAQISGGSVKELVASLNVLGVKPVDLIAILQGVAASGALNATLKTQ